MATRCPVGPLVTVFLPDTLLGRYRQEGSLVGQCAFDPQRRHCALTVIGCERQLPQLSAAAAAAAGARSTGSTPSSAGTGAASREGGGDECDRHVGYLTSASDGGCLSRTAFACLRTYVVLTNEPVPVLIGCTVAGGKVAPAQVTLVIYSPSVLVNAHMLRVSTLSARHMAAASYSGTPRDGSTTTTAAGGAAATGAVWDPLACMLRQVYRHYDNQLSAAAAGGAGGAGCSGGRSVITRTGEQSLRDRACRCGGRLVTGCRGLTGNGSAGGGGGGGSRCCCCCCSSCRCTSVPVNTAHVHVRWLWWWLLELCSLFSFVPASSTVSSAHSCAKSTGSSHHSTPSPAQLPWCSSCRHFCQPVGTARHSTARSVAHTGTARCAPISRSRWLLIEAAAVLRVCVPTAWLAAASRALAVLYAALVAHCATIQQLRVKAAQWRLVLGRTAAGAAAADNNNDSNSSSSSRSRGGDRVIDWWSCLTAVVCDAVVAMGLLVLLLLVVVIASNSGGQCNSADGGGGGGGGGGSWWCWSNQTLADTVSLSHQLRQWLDSGPGVHWPRVYVDWLAASRPAGLKLHVPLSAVLAHCCHAVLSLTQLLHTLLVALLVAPPLLLLEWLACDWTAAAVPAVAVAAAAAGGGSLMLSVLADMVAVAGAGVVALNVLTCCWWRLTWHWLVRLWRLFRCRRWNAAKRRVESWSFPAEQLVIGTLCFTVLLFLAPTVLVYYAVLAWFRCWHALLLYTLHVSVHALTANPLLVTLAWLAQSGRVAGTVYVTVLSGTAEPVAVGNSGSGGGRSGGGGDSVACLVVRLSVVTGSLYETLAHFRCRLVPPLRALSPARLLHVLWHAEPLLACDNDVTGWRSCFTNAGSSVC